MMFMSVCIYDYIISSNWAYEVKGSRYMFVIYASKRLL